MLYFLQRFKRSMHSRFMKFYADETKYKAVEA